MDGMLVHRRVTTQHLIRKYPFVHLGEDRHYESKVSCPRSQRSASAEARTRTVRSGVQRTNHQATRANTGHFVELKHQCGMPSRLFYTLLLFCKDVWCYCETKKTVTDINVYRMLLCYKDKAKLVREN